MVCAPQVCYWIVLHDVVLRNKQNKINRYGHKALMMISTASLQMHNRAITSKPMNFFFACCLELVYTEDCL